MTVFTQTWNAAFEALPADGNNISEGAQRIRNHRKAVRERLEVDHSWAGDQYDGEHKQITLKEQGALPSTPAAGTGIVTPLARGDGTGLFLLDTNAMVGELDGGFATLTDAAHDLDSDYGAAVPRFLVITPTGTERQIDLPSAAVRAGRVITLVNLSTTIKVNLLSSAGGLIGKYLNGHLTVVALQDAPTAAAHWLTINHTGGAAPSFSATKTGSQQVSTADPTKIEVNNEIFDTNLDFDPVTNYRWLPTIPGKYLVTAFSNTANLSAFAEIELWKGGVRYATLGLQYNDFGGGSLIVESDGTNYFEFYLDSAADSAYQITGGIYSGSFLHT